MSRCVVGPIATPSYKTTANQWPPSGVIHSHYTPFGHLQMGSRKQQRHYTFFWKADSPFSQWYSARFHVHGLSFNCSEQYMMYRKARLFGDEVTAQRVLEAKSPRQHKSLGRQVCPFDLKVWEWERVEIVYVGNLEKFRQNPRLARLLLATGSTIIVEASPIDRIWGAGLSEDDPDILDPRKWRGQNLLGEVLMRVRKTLAESEGFENQERMR